jgi:hypothetical protein
MLGLVLAAGGALLFSGTASAEEKKPVGPSPKPDELPPRPTTQPVIVEEPEVVRQGGVPELPRRGPGGTVLVSDLPTNCQNALWDAFNVGFDEPQAGIWEECIAMYNLTPSEVYNDYFNFALNIPLEGY